jgi:signal transduction histidine kinase
VTNDVAALREELDRRIRELEASETRFRSLITRNADAIVVVDGLGLVRFVNPSAEALFQRRAEDLVDEPFGFPLVAGETTELDVVSPSGAAVVAEMRVVATEWDGEPAHLAVLRDITERKRAEAERAQLYHEQVARAEAEHALRERDEFLAVASHELKTPLSTLSAIAQLLRRRLDRHGALDPNELRDALGRLDGQTRRVARLVTHLLEVSRINADKLVLDYRPVDLCALVADVVASCQATTTRHAITLRGPAGVEATVDPLRMEQLLTNLLDNAIKYSPDGGPIDVELSYAAAPAGDPTETPLVRLVVRDHGLGIPPDRRARLFTRFYQAHADAHVSGLGLGLFISRHIVELHGGSIDAEFPDDGGTRFVVTLPAGQRADA